jgi:hypothetical protein
MKRVFFILSAVLLTSFCFASRQTDSLVYITRIYKQVDTVDLNVHIFYDPATVDKNQNRRLPFFTGVDGLLGTLPSFSEHAVAMPPWVL